MIYTSTVPGAHTSDLSWRRSTFCASSGCVEIAVQGGLVAVRDSKRADSPVLTYDRDEWVSFVRGVKAGEFDVVE